jgi:hypothetical protein
MGQWIRIFTIRIRIQTGQRIHVFPIRIRIQAGRDCQQEKGEKIKNFITEDFFFGLEPFPEAWMSFKGVKKTNTTVLMENFLCPRLDPDSATDLIRIQIQQKVCILIRIQ